MRKANTIILIRLTESSAAVGAAACTTTLNAAVKFIDRRNELQPYKPKE